MGSFDKKLYAINPVGTEVKALALLFLRAGYSTKFKEDTRRESKIIPTGITCGLGFKLEGERKLGLDYAFTPCGNLGSSHRVSLSLFL